MCGLFLPCIGFVDVLYILCNYCMQDNNFAHTRSVFPLFYPFEMILSHTTFQPVRKVKIQPPHVEKQVRSLAH